MFLLADHVLLDEKACICPAVIHLQDPKPHSVAARRTRARELAGIDDAADRALDLGQDVRCVWARVLDPGQTSLRARIHKVVEQIESVRMARTVLSMTHAVHQVLRAELRRCGWPGDRHRCRHSP